MKETANIHLADLSSLSAVKCERRLAKNVSCVLG